jgi:nucleoside-diphosphate-sugar epimerase
MAALEKGNSGERYLLTGENITPARVFSLTKKYFGLRKPFIKIPLASLIPIGAIAEAWADIRGKRPRFHRGLAKLARYKFVYSCEKAKRELGYNPRPLEESIERILSQINQGAK